VILKIGHKKPVVPQYKHYYGGWLRNPAPVNRWFIPLFIGFQPLFWSGFLSSTVLQLVGGISYLPL
jgi:hypothetical protein